MASQHMTIDINGWPEALWAMRNEIAQILRDKADGEPQIVASKLRAIAAAFESGATEDEV